MKVIRNKKATVLFSIMLILSLALVGCGGAADTEQEGGQSAEQAQKGPVEILYVEWACATATSHVIADVLESKMGYTDVKLTPVTAALMYEGLSTGSGDAILCSWLPLTHGEYMDKVGENVEDLGPNMEGAKIGWVVPDYVELSSIEDLNDADVKEKLDGKITGIDSGAGLMKASEQVLTDYDLDYELLEGSDATMIAALGAAVDKNEWIVVTGWTPHWKFARWDLKYLDDPQNVFGGAETINTVVRQGLQEDMPEVYELFDSFHWTGEDLGSAMMMAEEEGANSVSAASKWVAENEELVNSWLPEAYK